jgi:putative transposase
MRARRPRLDPALYVGMRRYFLTFCTSKRQPWFIASEVVADVLAQFQRTAADCGFEIAAYCFMPDHVHLLIEARTDAADALAFVHQAKQRSGYAFAQVKRGRLWQPSFHDRILRDADATLSVVRYILENPVRAGLAVEPAEYPFSGSDRYGVEEMVEAVCWEPKW